MIVLSLFIFLSIIVFSCDTTYGNDRRNWSQRNYDFIIVGAGAAGAALAKRLSDNRNINVLLLEAGGCPLYTTLIPYFASGPIGGIHDWNFTTERQKHGFHQYVDQRTKWPRGKGLGGSTLINGMFVTRGNRRDYDLWEEMGNVGWGYDDVLPFFKRLENYTEPINHRDDVDFHGFDGPVTVSSPPYKTAIIDAFLSAGQSLGYPIVDYNARFQTGVADPVFILRNGERCSTYKAYLEPALNRGNLEIVTFATVTKVIFQNRRAIGVEFSKDDIRWRAFVNKEIILSAGAVNSPHLLLLSGIGPRSTLNKFNIPVMADLPGVGQNLQDHIGVLGLTFTANPDVGIRPEAITPEVMEEWETKREGPLTVPFRAQGIAFLNSKFANESDDYPDVEIILFQPPAAPVGLREEVIIPAFVSPENVATIITFPYILRPKSVGHITLRSNNPFDMPVIQPNYLSHPDDVEVLLDAVKIAYTFMNQEGFLNLSVKPLGSILPGCENFEQYSDEYFRCQIRAYPCTAFHPTSTCKMGTRQDRMAVVDPQLRVHGIRGLRIADASIFPTVPTAHTMIPAIMVGEKAAAMLAKDWNFQIP